MGKAINSVRIVLFLIVFVLMTASIHAQPRRLPPLNRDFFLSMAGIILVFLIYSIRTRSFIWPLWAGLIKQSRWLSAAHIVLFLTCFLFAAKIFSGGSFAWRIPLTLFVFGVILLIPGVYCQRKIAPDEYWSRAFRNTLLSLAIGFLFIPGFALVFYFTHALTAFLRD